MTSIPHNLVALARSGDAYALDRVLQHTQSGRMGASGWLTVIDIILHNFRPELQSRLQRTGSESLTEHYKAQIQISISCFDSLAMAAPQFHSLDPEARQAIVSKIKQHWPSHFRPHLHKIIEIAVDDLHPAISDYIPSSRVFFSVVCTFDMLKTLKITEVVSLAADPAAVEGSALMFCLYMDRYAFERHAIPTANVLTAIMEGGVLIQKRANERNAEQASTYSIFERDPRLIPNFVSFVDAFVKEPATVGRTGEFYVVLCVFDAAFCHSSALFGALMLKYPRFIETLMRIWSLHLSKNRGSSRSFGDVNTINRVQIMSSCIMLVVAILSKAGCVEWRIALRKHMLQLVLDTCVDLRQADPAVTSMLIEFFTYVTNALVPHLVHYSVLSPTLHALQNIQINGMDRILIDELKGVATFRNVRAGWILLCKSVHGRSKILTKYKKKIAEKGLCGSEKCPGNRNARSGRCGSCQSVHYCSDICQKEAWPKHKSFCSPTRQKERFVDTRDYSFFVYQVNHDFGEYFAGDPFDTTQRSYVECTYGARFPPVFREKPWPDVYHPIIDPGAITQRPPEEFAPLFVKFYGATASKLSAAPLLLHIPRDQFLLRSQQGRKEEARSEEYQVWLLEDKADPFSTGLRDDGSIVNPTYRRQQGLNGNTA